jgi:hypothetical protein
MSVLVVGGRQFMNDERRTVPDGNIFELTELYDERQVYGRCATDGKAPREIVMIDGRGYERIKPGERRRERVHDLTDIVDDPVRARFNEDLMKKSLEIIEKIAREMIPGIAERVVREEIEKIRNSSARRSADRD